MFDGNVKDVTVVGIDIWLYITTGEPILDRIQPSLLLMLLHWYRKLKPDIVNNKQLCISLSLLVK